MAKVTTRKETGKLVIDFTYRGVRCREQTALDDTPANRRHAEALLKRLHSALATDQFDYASFFPGSRLAIRFPVDARRGGANAAALSSRPLNQSPVTAAVAAAVAAPTPTFREFAAQWVAEHQVEWRRSHLRTLNSTLKGHLLPAVGDQPVGTITKADVFALRAKLAAHPGRLRETMSNKRINGIIAPLRQILNDAADRYGFVSPVATLKPLKIRKTDVEPFTLDQVQLLIASARPDYHDYFVVRFFTGMRTGECHGLKWKYVDFERRLILIRETFVLGEDEYTKTDSSQREIQMTQVVYEALKRQHAASSELSEYVFCNKEGKPLDNKNFSDRVWYPLLRHLGFKARRPYQMRHTAATLWLASGESPEWIARQLGHASTEMLFRVYSRYVPNLTRRDGSAIDRLLATRFASAEGVGEAANANTVPSESASSASEAPKAQPPPAPLTRAA